MSDFNKTLIEGKVGESLIAQWLRSRGKHILPVYEIEKNQYAGPAVYASDGRKIIAPDLLAFGDSKTVWIEAKHKSSFTWHKKTGEWTTGIDLHHYEDYLKISMLADWPVWLMFLHKDGKLAPYSPSESPTGLYGNSLQILCDNIHHKWEEPYGHQKHGMIYWSIDSLKKLDDYPLTFSNAA